MITDFALGILVASVVALGLVVAALLAALVWLVRLVARSYSRLLLHRTEDGAVTGQVELRGEAEK